MQKPRHAGRPILSGLAFSQSVRYLWAMRPAPHLLASGLALALSLPAAALAWTFYTTEDAENPQPLRWYQGRPAYTWRLSTATPGEADWARIQPLVEAAHDAWIGTECGTVPEFTFGGTSEATAATLPKTLADEPDNLVVFVNSKVQWQDSGNLSSWLAITKIASDSRTGQIIDADIEVNDGMYTFWYDDRRGPASTVDFRAMIVHELGHFYGLDHSTVDSAVMEARYDAETPRRALTDDDTDGVCALYADAPQWVDPNAGDGGHDDDGGCGAGGRAGLAGGLAGLAVTALRRRGRQAA